MTTAVSNATPYAVPAILTGKLPDADARPLASDHPRSLFTLLGGAYDMAVQESITRLCPAALCDAAAVGGSPVRTLVDDGRSVWAQQVGLEADADPLDTFREPTSGEQDPARFTELLDSLDGAGERTLHVAHLVLPHTPSSYLPSGRTYEPPDLGPFWEEPGRFFDLWVEDSAHVAVGRQRAILQTQYADGLVARLVKTLRERDLWDDSVVVVTADHGRAFTPGLPARGLDPTTDPTPVLPQLMSVPLFVHLPGEAGGRVDDRNVQTVDVLPTIAEVLGVDVPWELDGTSLLSDAPRPATKVFAQQVRAADGSTEAGRTFEVPAAGFLDSVLEHGVDLFRLHRADLAGRRLDDLEVGRPAGGTGLLHRPGALDDVDPAARSLPVFVTGEVTGVEGDVAVVVNGVVAGVSTQLDWDGRTGVFQVLVPEALLRRGPNSVALHAVAGTTLRPIALASS